MAADIFRYMESTEALQTLREGNLRYVQDNTHTTDNTIETRRELVRRGQFPFAAIVGCSDSRIPPEIIFDTGIGRLYVVRTAGNVVDSVAVGSVEYAVINLHVSLIIVLGHYGCAAVASTVANDIGASEIDAVLSEIRISLDRARGVHQDTQNDLTCRCENENIRHTVKKLSDTNVLREKIESGKLKIIGAKCNMATGEVEFWD